MRDTPAPTPDVLRARRYAARSRMAIALAGGALLAADPAVDPHSLTAAIGLGVIFLTGIVEATTYQRTLLRIEEPVSCLAGVLIVGLGEGHVTAISLLWLVAAAVGVLARGGRVGALGRVLVVGTLLSPIVTTGGLSAQSAGLACGSMALLLSTGRLSREMAELLRRARYDADHDALTGALAPAAFRVRVDAAAAVARPDAPLAVVLLDVDDFSPVNKRDGHAAGDALLEEVAAVLRERLGDGASLGRIEGDSFAFTLTGADPAERAAEIVASMPRVSASAGVARAPRDGSKAEALLGAADVALRVAKRAGKGRVVVYEGDPLTATGADGARAALARLLAGDGLRMAVQPIVDVFTGRVHAYEALARFDTPRGQGPLHWFALAEELGLRPDLERACLRAALELLPGLPERARLTVNLSAPMLSDQAVAELFADTGHVDRLVIEVTEEALARDDGSMDAAIAGLRRRDALFAVDDIGAGYSGLRQVATLRPSYLKLDRGLVQGIDADPARASLVEAMTGYAGSTGALLVAEGVEREEELAVLRRLGVPLVQGFLLGRPGPAWPAGAPIREYGRSPLSRAASRGA